MGRLQDSMAWLEPDITPFVQRCRYLEAGWCARLRPDAAWREKGRSGCSAAATAARALPGLWVCLGRAPPQARFTEPRPLPPYPPAPLSCPANKGTKHGLRTQRWSAGRAQTNDPFFFCQGAAPTLAELALPLR